MKDQLLRSVDRLGSRGQLLVLGIALATLAAVFYIVTSAGGAAYTTAFTNLDPKSAGDAQAVLAGAGIDAKLAQGGTALSIPSSKVSEARIALAQSDVPLAGSDQAGLELFDKSSMSETDMQQQVKWQRALSGEIAQTIESIDGIRAATVNLALPKDTVFLEDERQPTASVLIDAGGGSVPDESVRGIVRLVAASVPGLTPQHVTVANERGQLLSAASTEIGLLGADRLSAEAAWNRRMTALAQAQLDGILGIGAGSVVVTGELDLDQVDRTEQSFEKPVGALQASTEKEDLKQANTATAGGAGTPANLGGGATAGTGNESTSTYGHSKTDSTNAVPVTQVHTSNAPGDISRMSLALTVKDSAVCAAFGLYGGDDGCPAAPKGTKPADLPQAAAATPVDAKTALAGQVQRAVGWNETRDGADSFQMTSVAALPDAKAEAPRKAGLVVGGDGGAGGGLMAGGPLGMAQRFAKPAGAAIGLILLLFIVRRSLKRRQALLGTTDTSWLPALEAPRSASRSSCRRPTARRRPSLEALKKKQLQDRVEGIATERPQEVALAIRGWLAQGE